MSLVLPPELTQQIQQLNPTQLAWVSGYAWALSQFNQAAGSATLGTVDAQNQNLLASLSSIPGASVTAGASTVAPARRILILSCSQTGNARRVAEQLLVKLESLSANVRLVAASDYKSKSLSEEDIVLVVTSTQGEGEPPEEAVPFYKFLYNKKPTDLSKVSFAVLALGDSSYPKFCQAGKDVDAQMSQLGAQRLLALHECDLDFQASADQWNHTIGRTLQPLLENSSASSVTTGAVAQASTSGATQHVFTKETPYTAELLVRQRITTEQAKEVVHYEIDLSDSGIQYSAGDALGIYYKNSDVLIAEILRLAQVDAQASVKNHNGAQTSIYTALKEHLDITQTTPQFVQQYAQLSQFDELLDVVANKAALNEYIVNRPPIIILAQYPFALSAQQLHDLFRPLTPRLYSIASAQDEVGEEVHITVSTVRYDDHGQDYSGGASGYLADELVEGAEIKVFIEPNKNFRLPENGDTPIIMIGAGTGIAPFRSFIQQRQANDDKGANWLIFGNQKFTEDFLYQREWIKIHNAGYLPKYDFAWSRQGEQKVYVQHKLKQQSADVWQWLQNGAHIYVCGDATRMARDVENTLLEIIRTEGNLSEDDAEEYLNTLREDKRYQRDVY